MPLAEPACMAAGEEDGAQGMHSISGPWTGIFANCASRMI